MFQKKQPTPPRTIRILGTLSIQNELLSSVIEKETCCPCVSHSLEDIQPKNIVPAQGTSLVLLDCHGLDLGGIDLRMDGIRQWQAAGTKSALFNISTLLGTRAEQIAIKKGVDGVFFENNSLSLFTKGVSAILEGDRWFSRETLLQLLRHGAPNSSPLSSIENLSLTRREWEIVNILPSGSSNEEIAESLGISKHTVKTHMHNIFKKIGVSNRIQASMWASRNKLGLIRGE